MLMTISTCSQTLGEISLDSRPSTQHPFRMRVRLVNSVTEPVGAKPALNASMESEASTRAIASAIGLRQAFPMQTNRTLLRRYLLIRRFPSNNYFPGGRGLAPR